MALQFAKYESVRSFSSRHTKFSAFAKVGSTISPNTKSMSSLPKNKKANFFSNLQVDLTFKKLCQNTITKGFIASPSHANNNKIMGASPRSPYSQALREMYNYQNTRKNQSPKEILAEKWQEYHGSQNWQNLLDPLDANLRREVVKYGEFAQTTYDAFDWDEGSQNKGDCLYRRHRLMDMVGLSDAGYNVTKYLYGMSMGVESSWMGFVAVSGDKESKRIGRRDIVVAWRGTITPMEWAENLKSLHHPVDQSVGDVKIQRGYHDIYNAKNPSSRFNRLSTSEQVTSEVRRLVDYYTSKGEEVSLTITGHSLGGALSLLTAHELATTGINVPVSVITFAAPRIGNKAFKERLENLGVKTLRVVSEQDIVPKIPGLQSVHVGVELSLDQRRSPFLRQSPDPCGYHNLETYLHLLDGFESAERPHRLMAKRDVALVNKFSDLLKKELRIPSNWGERRPLCLYDDLPSPQSPSFAYSVCSPSPRHTSNYTVAV